MADWSKVVAANGVSRLPGGSACDPIEKQCQDAIIDLVICLRGDYPNLPLGHADRFLSVGEWGLAYAEVRAVAKDIETASEFTAAAIERARSLFDDTETVRLYEG
ncbi:hypothetical protein BCF33_1056 [Hasllibacter halocynthiae]|uniref:Uncharacterized protein n=1 Tax=Hasllibacter halocynthiae TaxID=595589 RepID=A0A2T0X912_9RHOB|nr:hypothetical protein [Hasllibacter halocynthiae]PRY95436.1 hypothetical protein BCF33_1056 [Hasllibacter halocynthiae]